MRLIKKDTCECMKIHLKRIIYYVHLNADLVFLNYLTFQCVDSNDPYHKQADRQILQLKRMIWLNANYDELKRREKNYKCKKWTNNFKKDAIQPHEWSNEERLDFMNELLWMVILLTNINEIDINWNRKEERKKENKNYVRIPKINRMRFLCFIDENAKKKSYAKAILFSENVSLNLWMKINIKKEVYLVTITFTHSTAPHKEMNNNVKTIARNTWINIKTESGIKLLKIARFFGCWCCCCSYLWAIASNFWGPKSKAQ